MQNFLYRFSALPLWVGWCGLLLFASTAAAQIPDGSSVSVSVSATVVSATPVELITLQNMVVSRVNRETGELYISPVTSANAGLMQLKGQPGTSARVNYLLAEKLVEENGRGSISIRYELSGLHEKIQHAANLIDTGEVVVDFGETGIYYLWIGGLVNLSNARAGRYTGQFTIEIEYI